MYAANGSSLPCFVVTLKEEIDAKVLNEAVLAALKFHPNFKSKLVKENGIYCMVENPKDPVIKGSNWEDEITYGGDDYNNYPWIITYTGKKIIFSAIHSLTDGGGTLCFLMAVTRQYLERKGVKFETPFGTVAEADVTRTIESLYEANGNTSVKGLPKPDLGNAAPIPASFYETDPKKVSTYRISLMLPDVKKFSIQSETSNFTVVAYVIAKAMEKALNLTEGVIKLRVPVSLRGAFKSISDRKSIIIPQLNYDVKRMGCLDRKVVETIFKTQLFVLSDKLNSVEGCNDMNAATANLTAHPDKLAQMAHEFDEGCNAMSAGISYSQATNAHSFGEMEKYMDNYEAYHFPECMRYMEIIGNTFNGKINLSVSQCSKDDILVKKIKEVLDEEHIGYEIEKYPTHGLLKPAKELFN